jgi:class 3 adenylate cyclase/tetratricopeptide (TPR) repeat protein
LGRILRFKQSSSLVSLDNRDPEEVGLLPASLRAYLVKSGGVLYDERAQSFQGLALVADMSGFTRTSEEILANHPHGSEQIGNMLTACFSPIIKVLSDNGFYIERFYGDALLATLETGRHEVSSVIRKVCSMLNAIPRDLLGTEEDVPRLPLRYGFAFGQMDNLCLGDPNAYVAYLAYGAPVAEALNLISTLAEYSVGFNQELGVLLNKSTSLPLAYFRPDTEELSPLKNFRSNHLFEANSLANSAVFSTPLARRALEDRQSGFGWELRKVYIIFATVATGDLRDQSHQTSLESIVRYFLRVIDSFRGGIYQIVQDENGLSCIAAFGVPTATHEDDAVRALKASVALLEDSKRGGFSSVAVAAGRAYCGLRSSGQHLEYAIVGRVINLAARMATFQTSDFPTCDENSAAEFADFANISTIKKTVLKGFDDAIGLHSIYSIRDVGKLPESTVGRAEELEMLANCFSKEALFEKKIVVLEGEPGIGKSHLLSAALNKAPNDGTLQISLIGSSADALGSTDRTVVIQKGAAQSQGFFLWRTLVRSTLGITDQVGSEQILSSLKHLLPTNPLALEYASLLNGLVDTEIEASAAVLSLGPDSRGILTQQLIQEIVLAGISNRPTVLILDDAHWLDSGSWVVLENIYRNVTHCSIVVATRPWSELSRRPPDLLLQGQASWHTISSMSYEQISDLARNTSEASVVSREILNYLFRTSGGNPFYCQQTLRLLLDEGLVHVDKRQCQLVNPTLPLAPEALPKTIEAIIYARLALLGPRDLAILKLASVWGFSFDLLTIEAAYSEGFRVNESYQTDLMSRGLIKTSPQGSGHEFEHALVRKVVYESVPHSVKLNLHELVAQFIERVTSTPSRQQVNELAYHWSEAENFKKAIPYLELVGEQSAKFGEYDEASKSLRAAIEFRLLLMPTRPTTENIVALARLRRILSQALFATGHIHQSAAQLVDAYKSLGFQSLTGSKAFFELALLTLTARFRRKKKEVVAEAALLADHLMQQFYFIGEPVGFLVASLTAIRLAKETGTQRAVARAYVGIALTRGLLHNLKGAEKTFEYAMELAKQSDRRYDQIMNRYVLGLMYAGFSNWEKSDYYSRHSIALAEQYLDFQGHEEAITILGTSLNWQGRFEESLSCFEKIYETSVDRGNKHHVYWSAYAMARALIPLGQIKKATDLLDEAQSVTHDVDVLSIVICSGLRATLLLHQGDVQAACASVAQIDSLRWKASSAVVYDGFVGQCNALVAALAAERASNGLALPAVKSKANRASLNLRAFALIYPFAKPTALLQRARYHVALGNLNRARKLLASAIDDAKTKGRMYIEATCYLERIAFGLCPDLIEHDNNMANRILTKLNCPRPINPIQIGVEAAKKSSNR